MMIGVFYKGMVMSNDITKDSISLITALIKLIENLRKGRFSEELFQKENVNYYKIDPSSYKGSIDSITMHLNNALDILSDPENIVDENGAEFINLKIRELSQKMVWMGYDRKPTKAEIEEQLSNYLSMMSLKSYHFYKNVVSIYADFKERKNMLNQLESEVQTKRSQTYRVVDDISSVAERIKSQTTIEVYEEELTNYKKSMIKYQSFFYITSGVFLWFVYEFTFGDYFDLNDNSGVFKFIYFKVTFCIISSVLITHFLRLSSFFRKKVEGSRRTLLELKALPSFVQGMTENDIFKIRKELIPCYFGRGNDSDSLDKLGDDLDNKIKIISDLLVATTGIIKESVKGNETNSQKKNNAD